MKEIDFSEFRVKYSAIFDQVSKTCRPIRVIHIGKPLVEIVPLSQAKNDRSAKRLRKKSPRARKAYLGR